VSESFVNPFISLFLWLFSFGCEKNVVAVMIKKQKAMARESTTFYQKKDIFALIVYVVNFLYSNDGL
jgi:hypothetical protein